MENDKIKEKALRAYKRWIESQCAVYQIPGDINIGRKYVYLYNMNGLLAKYNLKTGEISV